MTDDLKTKCEKTFYSELYHFDDPSQGLIMDETTGHVYLKKTMTTYEKAVYEWLKTHYSVHIPVIHSFWEEGSRLIVLEEYIQGDTLETLLRGKSLNTADRIRILIDVCDALTFLHSADIPIIHRDIKPSNIMLTNDGIVKLIDYDAAKVFHQGKNEDTTLIGTVGHAAPEQYGFAQSDARTDVYSMGILIREMLPGDVRFQRIISKATALDPERRYQTVRELKTAIEGAVSGHSEKKRGFWLLIPTAGIVCILCITMFLVGLYTGRSNLRAVALSEDVALSDETEDVVVGPSNAAVIDTVSKPYEDAATNIIDNENNIDTADLALEVTGEYGFIIAESCWTVSGSAPEGFVHYGAILENISHTESVTYPTVRVTAKDRNGRILGTDEMTGGVIMPEDSEALRGIISLSNYDRKENVIVDFSVVSGEISGDKGHPKSTDFETDMVSDNKDGMFPNVTGEITSNYKEKVSVAISALYKKNGTLVSVETSYVDNLIPGTPTAFEIMPIATIPDHDSVEIMVQEW